jgi:hypothetical protein
MHASVALYGLVMVPMPLMFLTFRTKLDRFNARENRGCSDDTNFVILAVGNLTRIHAMLLWALRICAPKARSSASGKKAWRRSTRGSVLLRLLTTVRGPRGENGFVVVPLGTIAGWLFSAYWQIGRCKSITFSCSISQQDKSVLWAYLLIAAVNCTSLKYIGHC